MAPVPQYQITTRAVMVALTLSPQQHVTVDRGTHDFVCSGKSITQNLFYRQLSNPNGTGMLYVRDAQPDNSCSPVPRQGSSLLPIVISSGARYLTLYGIPYII